MAKKSLIYFGAAIVVLVVIIALFALTSLIIGPDFWEYAVLIMPAIVVPSIILAAIGTRYGKKARRESKKAINTIASFANIILLVLLLTYFVLLILFLLLVFSFAG